MVPIVRSPCNQAGRQARVCRGCAGQSGDGQEERLSRRAGLPKPAQERRTSRGGPRSRSRGPLRYFGVFVAYAARSACADAVRERGDERTVAIETAAPRKAMSALATRAACRPSTKFCADSARLAPATAYEARIAPISAIPSEPPTCRKLLITPDPTPALSTGTEDIAADVIGDIVSAIPVPPISIGGSSVQYDESSPIRSQKSPPIPSSVIPAPISQREPILSDQLPASGAIRTMRMVIGRKVAPAFVGE